jgi:hypothetical protein
MQETVYSGHVARMAEMGYGYKILVGKPDRVRPFRLGLGIDGRIILKGI